MTLAHANTLRDKGKFFDEREDGKYGFLFAVERNDKRSDGISAKPPLRESVSYAGGARRAEDLAAVRTKSGSSGRRSAERPIYPLTA
ncbi:hypothetical protein [Jiella pelagia]|uniref:Uncharacterized protein n=1 Tax=Jiella pelagia TaxID=2986949 RepID=A0ABY7C3E4_9HYPH|nr:hypothetical protein [Jiella pelagia]WAP70548.1 hypothetical protein OH818_11215 [Jiella pelagia]